MSGESGRWVSRADSRRKNRAERHVEPAPPPRASGHHMGLCTQKLRGRRLRDVIRWVIMILLDPESCTTSTGLRLRVRLTLKTCLGGKREG